MLRPTQALLTALLSTTIVVTAALAWGGWRLLDQQGAIDEQRARDQAESAADAAAAGIRGKLAEAGERLSGWVSDPSSPIPAIDGAVVVATQSDGIGVNPAGGLPFVPVNPDTAPITTDAFAAWEAVEFSADRPERALAGYRRLVAHRQPIVRAGALLRLGRLQRKFRDFGGALTTYRRLIDLGDVRTDGLPAELAGLDGLRSSYRAMMNNGQANEVDRRLLRNLDGGRWTIGRGTAEYYREPFPEARPASWGLADALSEAWRETGGHFPARGQRIFGREGAASSVLVVWRSNGTHTAALAASSDRFFDVASATPAASQLVDPEGRIIAGQAAAPAQSPTRIIGNSEHPDRRSSPVARTYP